MPCQSEYLEATEIEKEHSVVLALLEELKTGVLPSYHGNGYYKEVYNKTTPDIVNKNTALLCKKLQKTDVSKYSLELQLWWKRHQEDDKKRLAKELEQKQKEAERKEALKKLTDYEKELLGIRH